MTITQDALIAAAQNSKAWPFQEAQRLAKRLPQGKDGGVLFETGYGPSGLPHIGTFQEVLRTTLVRRAYEALTGGAATRLVAFSDDMDGLRKVPDNVPNRDMLAQHMGKPLSRIPNPFGTDYESFAAHNNAMLRDFLDRFGFEYEFVSSSDCYNSGQFDDALKGVLTNFGAIMDIMLPTLGEERRQTYSPVMPISPTTGAVLQVPIDVVDAAAGIIRFTDENGAVVEQSALGGMAKCQWKVDWAMRWVALGVDYEMYGKDLTDSGIQSGKIARVLGGHKPEGLIYELFLDAKGEKISKSKGNGLSIDDWLTYGSEESLSYYIFANPRSAKQLHAGVIPKAIDDYWQFRAALPGQDIDKQLGNPVWHLARANQSHEGAEAPGAGDTLPVPFSLLLNLVGVLGAGATREAVWSYLGNYVENADPAAHPALDVLVGKALAYNRDFVAPMLAKRAPSGSEAAALQALDAALADADPATSAEDLQTIVYEIGKQEAFGFESLRDWFKALYETLLGSEQGPRMGSFIALYGIAPTRQLIAEALAKA
ncbi:lysine--tRNA ligase [Erythrobacter sanguineus]|jgi:lysyl-tRNA synthetase class 1|uniref:Lysine--tRNA ligase n=1 Tax=Erythrobacter sanguineus TaxID=198312 RepID=A0A1M7RRK4_9SPHN|nr:lysine--tRNA ligase [Erythrobacter sanguineus]MCR9180722.1 lysine--tRNA ligase [Erythrobacteraceae bacterium]SHN48698.1 lysyl-tRNA synthetase, class I [Erythrobacter sanguineus]